MHLTNKLLLTHGDVLFLRGPLFFEGKLQVPSGSLLITSICYKEKIVNALSRQHLFEVPSGSLLITSICYKEIIINISLNRSTTIPDD
jgi:hypothetical protein